MPPSFKLLVISIIVQAMQLMGQEGMVRGSGVERNYRDARWTMNLTIMMNMVKNTMMTKKTYDDPR